MKCPSCGVWNRAHFTKCFRCGADLTGAHADEPVEINPKDLEDEESLAKAVALQLQQDAAQEEPQTREPAAEAPRETPMAEPPQETPAAEVQQDAPAVEEAPAAEEPAVPQQIFSLYDNGDWDDEDEEDTEAVYGMASAPAQELPEAQEAPDAPVVVRGRAEPKPEAAELEAAEPEDDEPVTVRKAPEQAEGSGQETRKFAPVTSDAPEGATRKFAPVTDEAQASAAQPAAVPAEPEVAPTEPGISHEIIHAIFTNPPASMQPDHIPDFMDEPRPRKLMSRKRLPPAPEQEDEPATVYKPKETKAEPRVDNVEEFKPTARIAAQKADEQGDEFTAFATAKRNLVAEVEQADPFDAAIELPKSEKPEEAPAPQETPEVPQPEPQPAPKPEQPAWVREALLNLGSDDLDQLHAASTRPRRAQQPSPAAPRPRELSVEEEPATRYERAPRAAAPQNGPQVEPQQYAPTGARSGLEAIARYESAKSSSVLRQRNAQETTARRSAPTYNNPDHYEEEIPQSTRRSAARQEVAPRRETFRDAAQEQPDEEPLTRPTRRAPAREPQPVRAQQPAMRQERAAQAPAKGLKVQNLTRVILVGVAALLVLALLITGAVLGIRAIVKIIGERRAAAGEEQQTQQDAQVDPNAPVVTTGTVNGRPGHIITFEGNDDDIIYISNENLANSYNIPIVGSVGTLEIEDSVLIGNRYVTDDVEVTLNPVLHEAGSGKETNLDPVTFTVTPPDAYLEILSPAGGTAETTLSTYQVKVRVETGSVVTIDGDDVSDMIAEEDNNLGSIVYNVSVEPTGDNAIPVTVMKEGCKSVTENIVLTRPAMTVPIELDAATPSSAQTDNVEISGKVEAGVKVTVESPIDGQVQQNDDGSFKFTAKLKNFGDNEVIITATKGEESSSLTHVVTYTPSYNEYVAKAYRMDYDNLVNTAGKSQPFLCKGSVVEVYQEEPYTCLYNVGSEDDPKYIYLQMVEGKPLETGKTYKVYADVHQEGTKDGYPYMIGRFFVEAE